MRTFTPPSPFLFFEKRSLLSPLSLQWLVKSMHPLCIRKWLLHMSMATSLYLISELLTWCWYLLPSTIINIIYTCLSPREAVCFSSAPHLSEPFITRFVFVHQQQHVMDKENINSTQTAAVLIMNIMAFNCLRLQKSVQAHANKRN